MKDLVIEFEAFGFSITLEFQIRFRLVLDLPSYGNPFLHRRRRRRCRRRLELELE